MNIDSDVSSDDSKPPTLIISGNGKKRYIIKKGKKKEIKSKLSNKNLIELLKKEFISKRKKKGAKNNYGKYSRYMKKDRAEEILKLKKYEKENKTEKSNVDNLNDKLLLLSGIPTTIGDALLKKGGTTKLLLQSKELYDKLKEREDKEKKEKEEKEKKEKEKVIAPAPIAMIEAEKKFMTPFEFISNLIKSITTVCI